MRLNPFKIWYFTRQGYSIYLVYIIVVLNTITTLYYLAVKNIPSLQYIFPNVIAFGVASLAVAMPLTFLIGYGHYRRSQGQHHQLEIGNISNPLTPILLQTYKMLPELSIKEKVVEQNEDQLKKLDERVEYYLRRTKL